MTYPYETATEEQRRIGSWWWCVHHKIHLEPLTEPIENRVEYIKNYKPKHEQEVRLRNLAPVLHLERLPERLRVARAEYDKASAEYAKAAAEYAKAAAECEPELMALHREECPETTWNGTSIFGGAP